MHKEIHKEKLWIALFSLSTTIFLLLLSYQLVLAFSPLTPEQQQTWDYLTKNQELRINYSAAETSHLQDVHEIMKYAFILLYLAGICSLFITLNFRQNKKLLQKLFFWSGTTTLIFLGITLLLVFINFSVIFTLFHLLLFPQGNWTFPSESLLIQTFPLEFFSSISRNIFLTAFVFGVIILAISLFSKKLFKP